MRLIALAAVVGLLAPAPESADVSKRKQGAEGVAACSPLIDGVQKEGNARRRIQLILARAVHQIEAGNFNAALADATLARAEAGVAGLTSDPYYLRSEGRAFDLIEGAALFRMGKPKEAVVASLRGMEPARHSFLAMARLPIYGFALGRESGADLPSLEWMVASYPLFTSRYADRLEALGRFEDAAAARDALVSFNAAVATDYPESILIAQAALSHALAGHQQVATERAQEARANFDRRRAEGEPDSDSSDFVEVMDLYSIANAAASGELNTARRLFGARSQWLAPSFGAVVEMNSRLRSGATPDELLGALSSDPQTLWNEHIKAETAAVRSGDDENKALFQLIPQSLSASQFESLSRLVWRTDKSKLVMKRKGQDKLKMELMFHAGIANPYALDEAYRLHAALLARSRGHRGFVISPIVSNNMLAAAFLTGNPGDPGLHAPLFNDAEKVIAELSQIIPSPAMVGARRATR